MIDTEKIIILGKSSKELKFIMQELIQKDNHYKLDRFLKEDIIQTLINISEDNKKEKININISVAYSCLALGILYGRKSTMQ